MKLPGSLHRHLLLWSVGALAAVWLTFMVAALVAGVHEADERIAGDLATAAEVAASFTAALPPQAGPAAADVACPEAHEDQRHVSIMCGRPTAFWFIKKAPGRSGRPICLWVFSRCRLMAPSAALNRPDGTALA